MSTSFDEDNSCADTNDAYTRLVSGDLVLDACEIESGSAMIVDIANAYTKSELCVASLTAAYQDAVDAAISTGGNTIVSTVSKGANTAEFADWSWTSINNLLQ